MGNPPEADLVLRIKNSDTEALKEVINQYGKLVLYIIQKTLYMPHEKQYVDDCYNDVFAIIWFQIDQFNEERGSLKSWMIGIAKFKALEYKKRVIKENELIAKMQHVGGVYDRYHIEEEENIIFQRGCIILFMESYW